MTAKSESLFHPHDIAKPPMEVRMSGGTVSGTQTQLVGLFQTTPQDIAQHLKAIFAEAELTESATCKVDLQVRKEGALLVNDEVSGVPGIFAQAQEAGLPEPTIEEIAGRVRFTVRLAVPLPLLPAQSRRSGAGDALRLGPRAQSRAQSSVQSVTILKLLQAQALSSNELQLQMGLQTKTGAFKRVIKDLLDSGQIEYTMPDKPNSRLQKYRLTALGQAFRDKK